MTKCFCEDDKDALFHLLNIDDYVLCDKCDEASRALPYEFDQADMEYYAYLIGADKDNEL